MVRRLATERLGSGPTLLGIEPVGLDRLAGAATPRRITPVGRVGWPAGHPVTHRIRAHSHCLNLTLDDQRLALLTGRDDPVLRGAVGESSPQLAALMTAVSAEARQGGRHGTMLLDTLAATALHAVRSGVPAPRPAAEMLRAAGRCAARDGLAGQGIDLATGTLVLAGRAGDADAVQDRDQPRGIACAVRVAGRRFSSSGARPAGCRRIAWGHGARGRREGRASVGGRPLRWRNLVDDGAAGCSRPDT
ncbi:hypothetical protein ACH4YO_03215 [Streptomyces noursei]|uniref:hypothetical protein n=1 Tax=Streptomyces noursei TaxID=1971 RepID=UPI003403BD08